MKSKARILLNVTLTVVLAVFVLFTAYSNVSGDSYEISYSERMLHTADMNPELREYAYNNSSLPDGKPLNLSGQTYS